MLEAIAKVAKEVGKDVSKETGKSLNNFDKRKKSEIGDSQVDKTKVKENKENSINIDKRKPIDTTGRERISEKIENGLSEVLKEYVKELKKYSEHPETISNKLFDKIENVSPEMVKKLRFEFKEKKNSLIQQWEKQTGKKWPRYKNDVYITNKNGERIKIRNAGDYYDAHHIKPLSIGGKNTADNITPMRAENHYDSRGIHRIDGPCSKLQEIAKGNN